MGLGFLDDIIDYLPGSKTITGLGQVFQGINNGNAQSNTADAVQGWIDYDYKNKKANYDASVAYNDKVYQNQLAAQGAANANSASRANAARVNDQRRLKAGKKGNRALMKAYNGAQAMYAPHQEALNAVLPMMTGAYKGGIDNLAMLRAYLNTPESMAKLNQSTPATSIGIPLPKGI